MSNSEVFRLSLATPRWLFADQFSRICALYLGGRDGSLVLFDSKSGVIMRFSAESVTLSERIAWTNCP